VGRFELAVDGTFSRRDRTTNPNLLVEAKSGRFHLDLYYRRSARQFPPLQERVGDFGLLA
jgi:transcriptional regulator with GAF, ATPase, and Fis domain